MTTMCTHDIRTFSRIHTIVSSAMFMFTHPQHTYFIRFGGAHTHTDTPTASRRRRRSVSGLTDHRMHALDRRLFRRTARDSRPRMKLIMSFLFSAHTRTRLQSKHRSTKCVCDPMGIPIYVTHRALEYRPLDKHARSQAAGTHMSAPCAR